jgi:integrase
MQHGSLTKRNRLEGPDVWEFRWSEKGPDGNRLYRKQVIGTVDRYPDAESARAVVAGLIAEVNWSNIGADTITMTVAQLANHFEQRELGRGNTWRSYSTKRVYSVYLHHWIVPSWGDYQLRHVRTIEVESWLRRLPVAKSTCAKIRNVMSVLFNHACRYEFFDQNPIRLVRQSAKRKAAPNVLTPAEIRSLIDALDTREKALVLLAASTGLRQSEMFGLKWCDIDFDLKAINVTRSVAYGVVGPCKTESSQKPVPAHSVLLAALATWRLQQPYRKPDDWVFASKRHRGRKPIWGQAILRKFVRPKAQALGIQKRFG